MLRQREESNRKKSKSSRKSCIIGAQHATRHTDAKAEKKQIEGARSQKLIFWSVFKCMKNISKKHIFFSITLKCLCKLQSCVWVLLSSRYTLAAHFSDSIQRIAVSLIFTCFFYNIYFLHPWCVTCCCLACRRVKRNSIKNNNKIQKKSLS